MLRRFQTVSRTFLAAIALVIASLLFAATPAWAFRDGFQGWGGWTNSYDNAAAACFEIWSQCKSTGGCQPLGRLGPNSQFLGAKQIGPRSAGCMWTSEQWGCQGGIVGCGTVLPPVVGSGCGGGAYATRGFSSCYKTADAGSSSSCNSVGNPIMLSDGAKVEDVTDYASGDGEFFIKRRYRSLLLEATVSALLPEGPMGVLNGRGAGRGAVGGWTFDFQMELRLQVNNGYATWNSVTLYMPDGIPRDFIWSGSGTSFNQLNVGALERRYKVDYLGPPPLTSTGNIWANWQNNIYVTTTTWRVTDVLENRVWTLQTFPDPGVTSHSIARPVTMNKGGYLWTFAYNANGYLQSITDSHGRAFGITWNNIVYPLNASPPEPLTIKEITLPGGGKLRYTYDPPLKADGSSELMVRRIVKAEQLNSGGTAIDTAIYHYENALYPDFLTGITDGRGVRYATFAYDTEGRAISSEHSGAQDKYTVAYSQAPNGDLVRTVTNPLGKVANYSIYCCKT